MISQFGGSIFIHTRFPPRLLEDPGTDDRPAQPGESRRKPWSIRVLLSIPLTVRDGQIIEERLDVRLRAAASQEPRGGEPGR